MKAPITAKGWTYQMKRRLRSFLLTLILCLGAALLTVGLSAADLSSKNALDNPDSQVALAFSRTHQGLKVTLFNDSYELRLPAFLQKTADGARAFFSSARDRGADAAEALHNGLKLVQNIGRFLDSVRDRIV